MGEPDKKIHRRNRCLWFPRQESAWLLLIGPPSVKPCFRIFLKSARNPIRAGALQIAENSANANSMYSIIANHYDKHEQNDKQRSNLLPLSAFLYPFEVSVHCGSGNAVVSRKLGLGSFISRVCPCFPRLGFLVLADGLGSSPTAVLCSPGICSLRGFLASMSAFLKGQMRHGFFGELDEIPAFQIEKPGTITANPGYLSKTMKSLTWGAPPHKWLSDNEHNVRPCCPDTIVSFGESDVSGILQSLRCVLIDFFTVPGLQKLALFHFCRPVLPCPDVSNSVFVQLFFHFKTCSLLKFKTCFDILKHVHVMKHNSL